MGALEFKVDFQVIEKGKKAPQYTIDTDHDGSMTLEELLTFTKTNLILISDLALREEQDKGFDKNPVVTVDGRVGKPVINVNPLGSIFFTARAAASDIVLEIYNMILLKSPVDTGQYKNANVILLNGAVVATSLESATLWLSSNPEIKDGDIIRFIDLVPYARKLERHGITADRGATRWVKSKDRKNRSGRFIGSDTQKSILAPNGVYFLTFRNIQRKYKYNSKISFGFIPGGNISSLPNNFTDKKGRKLRNTYAKNGAPYLYPAITIKVQGGGVT